MSLKKIGKYWHVRYFSLDKRDTLITTGETDRDKAKAFHDTFMARLKYTRKAAKYKLVLEPNQKEFTAPADTAMHTKTRRKRYTFDEAFELYKLHIEKIPVDAKKIFYRFANAVKLKFIDDVTPQMAYQYLLENYGKKSGKTWNNNLTCLNSIYKHLVIPAGMEMSPFANIPARSNAGEHQRPFTDAEFLLIFNNANLWWRSAAMIAYWTGFRQESCFRLGPEHIHNNIITLMPGKTARFNRAVRIPLHPQLRDYLQSLPPSADNTFLGFVQNKRNGAAFTLYFGKLLDRLNITRNEQGIVNFNSIRNNFIDRCRLAHIAEHAIRGMVGQTSEEMTDLYSHEIESAMPLIDLPPVKIG